LRRNETRYSLRDQFLSSIIGEPSEISRGVIMAFCPSCGKNQAELAKFCVACGNSVSQVMVAAAGSSTIDVRPTTGPTWFVTYASGQTGGPFTEDEVRSMIARQQLKITDAVAVQGSSNWVPITQSPFAPSIAAQASMDRLASSTCPQCGGAMAVVLRTSGASKGLIITGLLTFWMFGFGIILIIIGYIVGRNPTPRYECPRCKYKSS
jgi:GYF domain 2